MSLANLKNNFARNREKNEISRRLVSPDNRFIRSMGTVSPISAALATRSAIFTNNVQSTINNLSLRSATLQHQVSQLPVGDFSLRSRGVAMGWEYERAILESGGHGTRAWTPQQRQEILSSGSVRDMHGHHINDVSSNPELQGNPDNIRFLNRTEHLQEHSGNWQNSTEGRLYNREGMLKSNMVRGEVYGFALAIGIGFGIAFSVSLFNDKLTWKERLDQGGEGALIGGIAYGGGRFAGSAVSSLLGVSINSTAYFVGVGLGASLAVSLYTFMKIRSMGGSFKLALKASGTQFAVSIVGILIAAWAQSIWGGPAGLIAAVIFSGLLLMKNVVQKRQMEHITRSLQHYEIMLLYPVFPEGACA